MSGPPRVAILGAGRMGSALYRSLDAAGIRPTLFWTRSPETAAAAQAENLPAIADRLPWLGETDVAFLAVDDTAVEWIANEMAQNPKPAMVAHVAGALDLTPLRVWREAGGPVGSFHPLMSVPNRRTKLSGTVAIEASTLEGLALLESLATAMKLATIHPTGNRARYHAAAVLVGNFPQVLLEGALRLLRQCGLSPEESRRAFGPLLESAARNAAILGPAAGLTGPAARGEFEVIWRHLQAMESSPEVEWLYKAATWLALDLAEQRGAPNVAEMRALLGADGSGSG